LSSAACHWRPSQRSLSIRCGTTAHRDKAKESEANQQAGPSENAIEAIRKWREAHPASHGAVPAAAIDSLAKKTGIARQELVRADQWLRGITPKAD